jgi:hypothetical protein
MPQSGLTEEQAYRLAQEQSKARREGRPIPPSPIQMPRQQKSTMSEEDAYRLAQEQTKARKEGRPISSAPVRTAKMKQGMTGDRYPKKDRFLGKGIYRDLQESGLTGPSGGPQFEVNPYASTNQIKMKQGMTVGMGNTDKAVVMKKANQTGDTESLNYLKQNQNTDAGQALGYAVDMVQRTKNTGLKDPSEYMRLLSGSEEFRKLKPEDQQLVRRGFKQWVQTQNVFNPAAPKMSK